MWWKANWMFRLKALAVSIHTLEGDVHPHSAWREEPDVFRLTLQSPTLCGLRSNVSAQMPPMSLSRLFRWSRVLEGGELLLGLLEEFGVGVGVSPEGKEVLVGIHSRGAIAFSGKSRAQAEPGERVVN